MSLKYLIAILLSWGVTIDCLQVDLHDLMNGQGLFLASSLSAYTIDNIHQTTFINWNNSNVLKLVKPSSANVSYQYGIKYSFGQNKVKHIQFKFASSSADTEDTNMRIMDSNSTTLVLFRAGRGGLVRVNQKQMISFYNTSISIDSDIKLTQVDLIINWEEKQIQIFINNNFVDTCQFFNTVQSVSQILLYNLYSSTSYWSDIVVCKERCYSFSFQELLPHTILYGVLLIMICVGI